MERGRHFLKEGERKRKAWEARDIRQQTSDFLPARSCVYHSSINCMNFMHSKGLPATPKKTRPTSSALLNINCTTTPVADINWEVARK